MEILESIFDSSNSFYKKAKTDEHENTKGETVLSLYSYNTLVCYINKDKNEAVIINLHSMTTLKHIKEFLKQNKFVVETKAQLIKDYMKEEDL